MTVKNVMMATAAVLALSPALAYAQATTAAPDQADQPSTTPAPATIAKTSGPADTAGGDIVITGTRIRRPNAVSTAPITTVDAQELKYQGTLNLEDALNRLPQVTPDTTQYGNTSDASGQAHINLRNLGWERTLVLVDGQRLGPAEGIDLNQIPVALVQRTDVVTGGASATYGSDAVAGVVNFILDKKFQGISLNGSYGFFQHTNDNALVRSALAQYPQIEVPNRHALDGQRYDVNLALGTNFADGRGHVSLFGGYHRQNPVEWRQRDFSACRLQLSGTNVSCATNTLYSEYGTFIPNSGPNKGTTYHLPIGGGKGFTAGNDGYAFNTRSNWNLVRGDRRYTAGGFFDYEFSKALSVYASGMYLNDKSSSSFGQSLVNGTATIGCDNPYMSAAQAATLCGAAAGTTQTTSVDLGYRFNNAGRPLAQNDATNKSYRIAAGIRGATEDGAWHYDLNYVESRVRTSMSDTNEIAPEAFLNAVDAVSTNGTITCRSNAPGCAPANIFDYHAVSDAFFNYASKDYRFYRTTKLRDVNANITGDLGKMGIKSPWASEGVGIALGTEYRYNSLRNRASKDVIEYIGFWNNNQGSFDAKEVYGEVQLPLISDKPFINQLDINGGYRLSKYQNQSKALDTSKIEIQYRPVRDLLLRGSFNRAARAPNVTQLYTPPNVNATFSGGDVCAGANPAASFEQCQRTGVTRAQYGTIAQCPDDNCRVVSYDGNPNLKPEDARTFTVGGVLTPSAIRGLTLSVDYYNIKITQYLDYVSATDYYNRCLTTGLAYYCRSVHRDPKNGSLTGVNNTGGYVEGGWQNTDTRKTRGIDVQGSYATPKQNWGALNFDFVGTYLIENGGRRSPAEQPFNTAGYFGPPSAYQVQPTWRHTFRTTYNMPWMDAAVSVNWRHMSGVDLAANSSDPAVNQGATPYKAFTRIPAYDFIDLSGSVKLADPVTLSLSMNNLFDLTPPVVLSSIVDGTNNNPNTFTGSYDPLGRSVLLTLSVRM